MRANWSPDFSSLALANSSRRSEKSHRSIMGVPARRDHVIEKVLSGALQFVGIFGRVIHKVFLCSEMLAVNVAFTNTRPTPDGRQAGSWELRPATPIQQPAICGIFDQSPLAGIILATRLPMTCGSCSPEEPSSV